MKQSIEFQKLLWIMQRQVSLGSPAQGLSLQDLVWWVSQWAWWSTDPLQSFSPSLPLAFASSCWDAFSKVYGEVAGLISFLIEHSSGQLFSNLNVQNRHLESTLRQFPGPHPSKVWFSRSGWGPWMCVSDKFSCGASTAGQRTTLWEPLFWKRTRRGGGTAPPVSLWFQCALSVFRLPNTLTCHFHYFGSSVSEGLCQL